MIGAGKKLVHGVGISDDGVFARSYVDEVGKRYQTKEYALWIDMLKRCYSEKYHFKQPTYKGCSADEYFKSFQQFSTWCQNQIGYKSEGYQLDKDLLLKGNKEYNVSSCVFIPRSINGFLTSCKTSRGEYPVGVYLQDGKYFKSLIGDGKGHQIRLGSFPTPELAFQAYKTAKEAMAKELAIQYEGLVDPRVIIALNNYVVNIGD